MDVRFFPIRKIPLHCSVFLWGSFYWNYGRRGGAEYDSGKTLMFAFIDYCTFDVGGFLGIFDPFRFYWLQKMARDGGGKSFLFSVFSDLWRCNIKSFILGWEKNFAHRTGYEINSGFFSTENPGKVNSREARIQWAECRTG